MIVLGGEDRYNSVDVENKPRTVSEYNCLRGRLIHMEYDDEIKETQDMPKKKPSNFNEEANRTTRIFKRFYITT